MVAAGEKVEDLMAGARMEEAVTMAVAKEAEGAMAGEEAAVMKAEAVTVDMRGVAWTAVGVTKAAGSMVAGAGVNRAAALMAMEEGGEMAVTTAVNVEVAVEGAEKEAKTAVAATEATEAAKVVQTAEVATVGARMGEVTMVEAVTEGVTEGLAEVTATGVNKVDSEVMPAARVAVARPEALEAKTADPVLFSTAESWEMVAATGEVGTGVLKAEAVRVVARTVEAAGAMDKMAEEVGGN